MASMVTSRDKDLARSSRYADLLSILRSLAVESSGLIVAYSGGVDSAFLLAAAVESTAGLGESAPVTALTAISPSYPTWEREPARALTTQLGVAHLELETSELSNPDYRANAGDRCFHCKRALFDVADWARESERHRLHGALVYGAVIDDLGDHRPGMNAAQERAVRAPLIEAHLSKADVRSISRDLGLSTWDKPASACLSSRFPYGVEVTAQRLEQVGRCESRMHTLGLLIVRARYHQELVRLEFGQVELERIFLDPPLREIVIKECKAVGFKFVSIDLQGYRSGSANEALIVLK